jgi:uncharacterized RDD family membrane protein YckC
VASIIDTVAVTAILAPILLVVFGRSYFDPESGDQTLGRALIELVLVALFFILFWMYRSATPGKMIIRARIVDAKTGEPPSKRQCVVRYLGYYVSMLPLFIGFLWIAADPKKQGWHDKLAGTVVVRDP